MSETFQVLVVTPDKEIHKGEGEAIVIFHRDGKAEYFVAENATITVEKEW